MTLAALPTITTTPRYTFSNAVAALTLAIPFPIYGDGGDLKVFLDGAAVTTGWSLKSSSGSLSIIPRPITDGYIEFTSAQTGLIEVYGKRIPRRTTNLSESPGPSVRDFNYQSGQTEATLQEIYQDSTSALKAPLGEYPLRLPSAVSRAGKFLYFAVGTGEPTASEGTPTTPADGSVTTAKIATAAVTNAKLADMAEATFKMRARGAGAGVPIDGTSTQATVALGLPVNVLTYGADPAGVADSFAAFQAAKTAAGSRGTIRVPAGTYNLSASVNSGQYIWFKEGVVTLTGAGASAGLPFIVREFGSSDGVADGFYSGPDSKWINTQFASLTGRAGAATVSELVGVSHWGNVGTLGASRTSDSTTAAAESSIGLFGIAINDNATQVQTGYGLYVDAYRASGAGTTFGGEIDIINVGSIVQVAPNAMFPAGATSALRLASGGSVAGATTASSALEIIGNTKKFAKGIVFKQDSLTGTDGLDGDTGTAIAMAMGKGMGLQWYNNAGSQTAYIYSTCHSTGVATGINFAESAFNVIGTSDARSLLQVEATASAVNRIVLRPSATGVAAEYTVAGDTNASVKMTPAGTGTVYAGAAAVPSGRPTNPGRLMLTDYGGLASNSGFEFQSAAGSNGYGWKLVTPDEGAGSTPLIFGARQGSATWTEMGRLDARGDFVWGTVALATGATNGFVWIPSCAGAPSGAPTSPYTNAAALIADTTNSRLYVRVGSTWKYATLT